MNPLPLLDIEGLSIQYRTPTHLVDAVRHIDLKIYPGEIVAIVGESGSGKSTTAAALIGLLPSSATITAGHIRLNGEALENFSERRWNALRGKQIGFVPQDPALSLDPVKRIGDQVMESLTLKGVGKRQAHERSLAILSSAGLRDVELLMRRYPHQISGGMRQRVLIAIALANNPPLLIADEPTSALDVSVQRQILDHLQQRVREQGTAVLLITHDLGVAMDRADRVVVMQHGQVVEIGSTQQIFEQPQHPYTRQLLAAAPSLAEASLKERPLVRDGASHEPVLLQVQGLSKNFSTWRHYVPPAVELVSFDIHRQSTLSLVGESGSGKSTTARMILGLEPPSAGAIRFAGDDVLKGSRSKLRDYRRQVQVVYQNPYASLDPRFNLEQIISEPLHAFSVGDIESRRQLAVQLLERVGIPARLLHSRPAELSGGQRQRIAIARALALKPRLVILDEPLSALDASVQKQILDLLAELQRDLGLSYLFISHDLAVVREISDQVVVMRSGKVVEQGSSRQIFESPANDYTRQLLQDVPGQRYLRHYLGEINAPHQPGATSRHATA